MVSNLEWGASMLNIEVSFKIIISENLPFGKQERKYKY
ncbi:hypothetical protein JCM19301_2874 [Jejuia pallidilutea]|uniref:Uncharacterized protein n=1 Tax=Jejuia pallidilutea TaxID=504487 RepID=A0A090W7J3_9FLAO|nr:hypothetical protein JCM19301_2874 [Jejuia pallidilutea]GAL72198.1 hypothetical protein JCM19302_2115 [Jejuia pallidilutea]GAL89296.1 hypothetical protein JCM19538_1290 [Jejuia pallidilutea]